MKTVCIAAAAVLLTSCMSKNEMYLRKKDIEAKAAHPVTYQPLVLNGPLTMAEGSMLTVSAPTQPYVPTVVPNGQEIWANAAQNLTGTAAITSLGIVGTTTHSGDTKKISNSYNTTGGAQ